MDLPMQQAVIMSATEPVAPAPQHDSQNSFIVLVLIVSLVISTIAVFLFWQNQQLRNEIVKLQSSPLPSASPVPSPVISPSPSVASPSALFEAK